MSDFTLRTPDGVQGNYLIGDDLLGAIDGLDGLDLLCYPIEEHKCSARPPVDRCGDVLEHTRVRSYCSGCSLRPEVKYYIDEWWKCANTACTSRKDDISTRGSDYCPTCRCAAFGCIAGSMGGPLEVGRYCQGHGVLPKYEFTSMCQATYFDSLGEPRACGGNKVYGSDFCSNHCCKDVSGCARMRDACYSRCWECQKNAALKGADEFLRLAKLYNEEKDASAKWVDWEARVEEINKFICPNTEGTAALYKTFPVFKKHKGGPPPPPGCDTFGI